MCHPDKKKEKVIELKVLWICHLIHVLTVASALTLLLPSGGGLVPFSGLAHGSFLPLQSSQAYRSRKMLKLLEAMHGSSCISKNNKGKAWDKLASLAITCELKEKGGGRLTLAGCTVKQYRLKLGNFSLYAFLLFKVTHNQLVSKASLLTLPTALQTEHVSQIMWIFRHWLFAS